MIKKLLCKVFGHKENPEGAVWLEFACVRCGKLPAVYEENSITGEVIIYRWTK